MSGGKLTPEQLRQAIERAEKRVELKRSDHDIMHARRWLQAFQTRLERAEAEGRA